MTDSTFVIAEAGVNHDGSLEKALHLIDVAATAGADAVKFQTFQASKLVTAVARKAQYQIENTKESGGQFEMLKRLELSLDDHRTLVAHCKARGIRFMSTAFDADGLAFLATLGMPALKVPSGDITCAPLLLKAARTGMPLIVSTGMSTIADIELALGVIAFGRLYDREPRAGSEFVDAYCSTEGRRALRESVTLLHCVTQYPAPPESVNLRAMDTMAAAFGLPVGYSDHTLGIGVSLAAVARGATVIEKHFTLDRTSAGPDHAASLEPGELAELVRGVRHIELALGSPIKGPAPQEVANRPIARRSLVAARPIKAGAQILAADLAYKRPGSGISPMHFWDTVGRTAARDFDVDEAIEQ